MVVVLIVALVAMAILTLTISNQTRVQQLTAAQREKRRFDQSINKMRQILQTAHLCTCNLRDLETQSGDGNGPQILLTDVQGNQRSRFGYVKLVTKNNHTECGTEPLSQADTVVQIGEPPNIGHGSEILFVSQMRIGNFVDQNQTVTDLETGESLKRFAAKIILWSTGGTSLSRSNMNSPIELPIYVELKPSGSNFIIRKCYSSDVATGRTFTPTPASSTECYPYGDYLCPGQKGGFDYRCILKGGVPVAAGGEGRRSGLCGATLELMQPRSCECATLENPSRYNRCGFEIAPDFVINHALQDGQIFCSDPPPEDFTAYCGKVGGIAESVVIRATGCGDRGGSRVYKYVCACP